MRKITVSIDRKPYCPRKLWDVAVRGKTPHNSNLGYAVLTSGYLLNNAENKLDLDGDTAVNVTILRWQSSCCLGGAKSQSVHGDMRERRNLAREDRSADGNIAACVGIEEKILVP